MACGLLAFAGCSNEATVSITNLGEREVIGCVDQDCAAIAPDTTEARDVVEWLEYAR